MDHVGTQHENFDTPSAIVPRIDCGCWYMHPLRRARCWIDRCLFLDTGYQYDCHYAHGGEGMISV
ncbi:hypothetical protein HETIRDRAFT_416707 [Heterobasidion irregulare TC 32-1]|uniref:Uncharacterized protein n=1 Tax=Heterobasidion irregulare (strain TC 32-1) TaxID=747525 RepID=W4KBX6_HETIT|nr:uncharacterized protein HETIRDRAFT_416707 [Heterobasidion irregulare TC 32-1]ETW82581.1 hypothetical protein HETIRDRAFT_416707 [Heterobasidion irregulare TC 32-1]